jgi:hypothetical protein
MRAAFRAAAERAAAPFVAEAFFAAADRLEADLRLAARLACLDRARCEAALRPSRFKAPSVARERLVLDFARAGAPWPRA